MEQLFSHAFRLSKLYPSSTAAVHFSRALSATVEHTTERFSNPTVLKKPHMSFLVVPLARRCTWRGHPHAHISLLNCHRETQPVIGRPFPNQALYSVFEWFQWVLPASRLLTDSHASTKEASLACVRKILDNMGVQWIGLRTVKQIHKAETSRQSQGLVSRMVYGVTFLLYCFAQHFDKTCQNCLA